MSDQKASTAAGYFVLSYCLLVPIISTIGLFILLNHAGHDALVFGGIAAVYFSSMILGLFHLSAFKSHGRAEFWALLAGIFLGGAGGVLATGACIVSCVGLPFLC